MQKLIAPLSLQGEHTLGWSAQFHTDSPGPIPVAETGSKDHVNGLWTVMYIHTIVEEQLYMYVHGRNSVVKAYLQFFN